MPDFNKVLVMGRLTADPELRNISNGVAVCNLRMAVNRKWTTKEGEAKEEVTWLDVTAWKRLAENCAQMLEKGNTIFVDGYLKTESWDDKNTGEKRSKIVIEANNIQFITMKARDGGNDRRPANDRSNGGGDWENRNQAPSRPPAITQGRRPPPPGPVEEDDDDSGIPF